MENFPILRLFFGLKFFGLLANIYYSISMHLLYTTLIGKGRDDVSVSEGWKINILELLFSWIENVKFDG